MGEPVDVSFARRLVATRLDVAWSDGSIRRIDTKLVHWLSAAPRVKPGATLPVLVDPNNLEVTWMYRR